MLIPCLSLLFWVFSFNTFPCSTSSLFFFFLSLRFWLSLLYSSSSSLCVERRDVEVKFVSQTLLSRTVSLVVVFAAVYCAVAFSSDFCVSSGTFTGLLYFRMLLVLMIVRH